MTHTFQITCTPKEGYVANRQHIETKEIDEENKYTFIKDAKNGDIRTPMTF